MQLTTPKSESENVARAMSQCGVECWGACGFEPDKLLPVRSKSRVPDGAESIIVILVGYYFGDYPERNVSRYALADDYHGALLSLLSEISNKLAEIYPEDKFVPFVDASPVAEVRAAARAGLGDIGMNGQLLSERYGSYCFIGEIVTTLDLPPTMCKADKLCTRCGKCAAACPTGALGETGLDKTRCRSQITQKKGELDDWERAQIKAGGYVWGCDSCTDACPVNRRIARRGADTDTPPQDITPVVGEDNLEEMCVRKAYGWRGAEILRRNLRILDDL